MHTEPPHTVYDADCIPDCSTDQGGGGIPRSLRELADLVDGGRGGQEYGAALLAGPHGAAQRPADDIAVSS